MMPQCNRAGMAEPVTAKVALISPALDPGSTTVEVWIKIDNKSGTFKVGTPVKVSITDELMRRPGRFRPNAILTAQDGSKSVMVVGADGAAHKKAVTLGLRMRKKYRLPAGLRPPIW